MNLITVLYSGTKPYTDKTALRNEWQPGDKKVVTSRDAKTLCRFAEFAAVETDSAASAGEVAVLAAKLVEQQEARERETQNDILLTIESMDKDALEAYALKYEVGLDKRRSVANLRTDVATLVEQYGAR